MQQFLDMCWLYADKQEISRMYMLPVVMATTYGERDAELNLIKAWELLGGIPITGLVAYVDDGFEQNESYREIIEKKAEALYRTIHQKMKSLPTSDMAVKNNLLKPRTIELTPQESEQLSKFVSDESYVKQQKEDIEELSAMFKKMLKEEDTDNISEEDVEELYDGGGDTYVKAGEEREVPADKLITAFKKNYSPQPEFTASYAIIISDKDQILHIEAAPEHIKCFYAATDEADVILRTTTKMLDTILDGKKTFQKGFMAGEISAKGNFKTLRMLDTIFDFQQA